MDSRKLQIAILSSPCLGYLIPVLVLGNRLATHHDVKVTVLFITTRTSTAESQFLKLPSGPKLVDILEIPPVDISHFIDANTKVVTQLCIMVREALPGVRSTIAGMKHRPDVFIGDLFCTEAFPIATEFDMHHQPSLASGRIGSDSSIYRRSGDNSVQFTANRMSRSCIGTVSERERAIRDNSADSSPTQPSLRTMGVIVETPVQFIR